MKNKQALQLIITSTGAQIHLVIYKENRSLIMHSINTSHIH